MTADLSPLLAGLIVGLALGLGWRWAGERRERRSRDAAQLLDRLTRAERELERAMAMREALLLRAGDAGEWWRPAVQLAAGLRDAAEVCGDPRLAELPDPAPVQEVIRAAARSREALRAEVLPPPAPTPESLVLVRRSAGVPVDPPSTEEARAWRAS
ncbi:MAG TPA: hypothetical protein PKD59_15240 [Miltoncostaeaceae bacterium]|nr:hypothetical protein [Miltoncostaeaceae bacterium]